MLHLLMWTLAIIAAAAAISTLVMTFVVRYLPAWMGVELQRSKVVRRKRIADVRELNVAPGVQGSPDLRRFRRAPWTAR